MDKDFSAEVYDNFVNSKGVQSLHNYDGKSSIGDTSSYHTSNQYNGSRNYHSYNNNYNNNRLSGGFRGGYGYNNSGQGQRQVGTAGNVSENSSQGTGANISLFSR